MPGSFDFDPYAVPLGGQAVDVGVFRYDPALPSELRFEVLPNVRCERIRCRDGSHPPVAQFRYLLDDTAAAQGFPSQFEELWPLEAFGPYLVRPDERLVVMAWAPTGARRILFDGFAQTPRVDLTPESQSVSFTAVGVEARCWDSPIGGRRQRHADNPHGGAVVSVDLPTRFNPDGRPNCTPDGHDVRQNDPATRYPVFLDPSLDRTPDPRSYWTLGKLVRYLLSVHNDQAFVRNPDFSHLDEQLQARAPREGSEFLDPLDSERHTAADMVVRDFDATNLPWPEALSLQLGYAGFGMRFVTGEDELGEPRHDLEIYRKDGDPAAPKELELPQAGSRLNPARCNVAELHLTRDTGAIVNAVTVETRQRRVELSCILAPGFAPSPGDELASARHRFLRAHLGTASGEDRRKYRFYVADEAGDGHWDFATASWSTTALDLSPVFPNDDRGRPTYVRRLRPGSQTLISRDSLGRRRRAQLALSRDYSGPAPAVWNGSGTWQPIAGGWELLEDRLGIYVTVEDPEAWAIGSHTGPNPQEPSPTLRGITSLANPAAPNTRFYLRLTTVIDDDLMLPAVANARPASPTVFTLRRRVDARDHFKMETVAPRSLYNPGSRPIVVHDDTERALAHARQLRAAYEFPPLSGSITIPSIVTAFQVGDRIGRINGRDLSFQTNLGDDQGEAPSYPSIVAVSWDFTGDRQATILELADWPDERGN